jgi:hypothetical protein
MRTPRGPISITIVLLLMGLPFGPNAATIHGPTGGLAKVGLGTSAAVH